MTTFRNYVQLFNYSVSQLLSALLLIFAFLFLFAQSGHCISVNLAWDPNSPSENVAGYKLYYGNESRSYSGFIDITNGTLKKISKLVKGQHYYFAVTAYNEAGQESDFSEELVVNTCKYKLSSTKKRFKAEGGVGAVKLITQPNCEWTAISGADWLHIMDGHDGIGPGLITYSVDPNSTPEKKFAESNFGGKSFTVITKGSTLP